MTAINVILHSDAAHVITDGAGFEGNSLRWQTTKAWPLPHLNAVVAVSGKVAHAPLLAAVLGIAAPDYDGLKLRAVQAVREAEAVYGPILRQMQDERFVLVVAGISGEDGPDAYVVTNDPRLGEPYTVIQAGPLVLTPGDAETHAAFAAEFPGITSGDELDPESDGLRILDLQRRRADWGIGAFAQLTTVTRRGISTRIIHRYAATPDLRRHHAA